MLTAVLVLLLGATLIQADGEAACERVTNAVYGRIMSSSSLTPVALGRIQQVINIDITNRQQLRDFICTVHAMTPAQTAGFLTQSGIAEAMVRVHYGIFVAGLAHGRRQLQQMAQAPDPQVRQGAALGIRYIDALYDMGFDDIDPQAVSEGAGFFQAIIARFGSRPGPQKRSVGSTDQCAELREVIAIALRTMPPPVKARVAEKVQRYTGLNIDSPTFANFHCAVASANSIGEIVGVLNQYGTLVHAITVLRARFG